MRQALDQLQEISDLLSEDSEAAERELQAFRLAHSPFKHKLVAAKTDLLSLIIASVFNKFEQQQVDDTKLLTYFEGEEHYEEAAQLLLAKARHYFMNSKVAEGEALLHYVRDRFLEKISLRSQIVYMTRVAFVHGRRREYDEMANVSMQAIDKLKGMEPKTTWYYSIYTIFCTNIAECYHTNSDFEKAWPYLQQSLEIAETQNIPDYNKYNVYSFVAFYHEYRNENLVAAQWLEKIITLLRNKPAHEYYEMHSHIAAARQYAVLARQTPESELELRSHYINKQDELLTNVSARIKSDDGNYLVLLMGLAELEYQRKDYEKAASFLNKALDIYTQRSHHKGIVDCHTLAHQVYCAWGEATNDLAKVLTAYQHLKTASDMIAAQAKQTNLQKIEAIEAKHQLQQKKLSEQLMQQQIESMNKEMRLTAINMQEKITLLDELKDYVHSLKKKEFEKKQFIGAISQKIGAIKITEEDKALLQEKMDAGNAVFVTTISDNYPQLSAHEVRMCVLFKTGLTNKELSRLYGLDKRAYEQLRYRIKRKMALDKSVDLLKHLAALSAQSASVGLAMLV